MSCCFSPQGFLVALLGTLVTVGVATTRGQVPQQPPPPAANQNGFIAGQVIELGNSRPVPNATVQLLGRGGVRSVGPPGAPGVAMVFSGRGPAPVVADSQGRFFFSGLAPGSYSVIASKPGYGLGAATVQRSFEVTDGGRVLDWKVRLSKFGLLAGSLRDDSGDPVVETEVFAIRRTVIGGRVQWVIAGRNKSDDRGSYRLLNLPAGDYLVCACSRDPIPFDSQLLTTLAAEPSLLMGVIGRALGLGADVAKLDDTLRTFPPTFYPSSATTTQATRISLASGDEKTGVDFTLVPVRATRVSGTVVGASGPVVASAISLMPAGESADAVAMGLLLPPVLVQPDGRFDFAGVPPGQYVLRVNHVVTAPGSTGPSGVALQFLGQRANGMGNPGNTVNEPMQWAAQPVSVGEGGVSGLNIALHTSAIVKGRVEFSGGNRPSTQTLRSLVVVLRPLGVDSLPFMLNTIGRVADDGTFEIRGVPPGRYAVDSTSVPGFSRIQSVTTAGSDVTEMPIEIGASDVGDLVVTFTAAPAATLAGTGISGETNDDLVALIFPTDRKYWTDPDATQSRFRLVPVGRNGSFLPLALSPGEYCIAVVPDRDAVGWMDAAKLEAWSARAQRVSLAEGETKTVEVRR